uniref:Si:ch73-42p12.2 n=1 Tax=Cyprinus carpio carpio TaxID=630221 RepID=A0A9J8C0T5_CYPCA
RKQTAEANTAVCSLYNNSGVNILHGYIQLYIYTAKRDPFRQLKDLSLLKDQLDNIQRRVEDEVGVGIPQGGSVLSSPFLKGFLAGYVVAKLRSSAVLGVLVGTCTGIYAAQSYQVPNVEQTIKNYFSSFKKR